MYLMKTLTPVIGLVATAALLTGCSSGTTGTTNTDQSTSTDTSTGADGAFTIGFVAPTASETYWTSYINGTKAKAEELGVTVNFTDGRNDANTQLEQVNSLIVSGVDAIVLTPVDTTSLISAAAAADDANIPLITSNRALDMEYGGIDGASPKFHVGFNDVEIGRVQGNLIADFCADIDPCNVAYLLQPLGSTPQIERSQGAQEILADHANITIVTEQDSGNDPNKGMELTRTIIQQNPDLNLIVAQYDEVAVAAAKAVQEAGLAETTKLIGLGGSKNGIAAVEAGDLIGTVWVSPSTDGATALQAVVDFLNGNTLELDEVNNRPTVPVTLVGVTAENVADYPGEW